MAEIVRKKDEDEDHKRFVWQKEDSRRTWSWNAYYHRSKIKEAQKDIAYHQEKLGLAQKHNTKKKQGGEVI